MLWIDLKRKNALGGIDAVSNEEQNEMNSKIVELIRRVRWRMDQELTRRNVEPVFKDFYADKYDKEEFLIDAGFEFSKLKNLVSKNPNVLREDPLLSLDYYKIIQLLKQKNILDRSEQNYGQDMVNRTWQDVRLVEKKKEEDEQRILRKYMYDKALSEGVGSEIAEQMALETSRDDQAEQVKSTKKQQLKN